MDTMTFAPPTIDPPAPPPPTPKKKISKGWIVLALVIVAGIIGAISTAKEEAQFDTDVKTQASRSLDDNVTNSGELDEVGYVRDMCASALDTNLPDTDSTVRQGLAAGNITVLKAADAFAEGYYDSAGSTTDLTRSEVISACATGLRNG
jgi:hypothetical protein